MGLSSSKTKTKSTTNSSSTPLDQYAPYITQGLTSAKGIMDSNQSNMEALGGKALDIANGFAAPNAALSSIYGGQLPSQHTFTNLQNAGANDPSIGALKSVIDNAYSNPAFDPLKGFTNPTTNGDTSQFYKDTLSGKFLNGNPYLDNIVQQGTDAATKAQNLRFASLGMGEGMSTPYAQALGQSVADANNQLRYGAYKDELGRMGQIGAQSDAQYNAGQDRAVSAASSLGSLYNQAGSLKAGAAQGLGSQYNADNAMALAGANGDIQSRLSALAQVPGMTSAQLGALGTAAALPYTGVNQYANLVNGLTAKYGNQNSTTNSTQTQSGNIGQMLSGVAGSVLGGLATGGLGSLGGLGSIFGGASGGLGGFLSSGLSPLTSAGGLSAAQMTNLNGALGL